MQVIAQFGQNYLAGISTLKTPQIKPFDFFGPRLNAGETFQAYDYGKKGNLKRYGSPEPYEYPLGKISAPVRIRCHHC